MHKLEYRLPNIAWSRMHYRNEYV